MNRRLFAAVLAATFLMPMGSAFAQSPASAPKVTVTLVKPIKTVPFRTMKNLQLPALMRKIVGNRKVSQQYIDSLHRKLVKAGALPTSGTYRLIPLKRIKPAMQTAPAVHDSALQRAIPGSANAPAPKTLTVPMASFDGIGQSSGNAIGCEPPDTDAATGQNYVVEIVNECDAGVGEFEVYDKTGTSQLGPIPLAALWTSGNCLNGEGDSVVLYDQLAQRWVLSQFALNASGSSVTDECVAVSATSDPTGSYYIYDFSIDPNGFTDYPKLGVWPDAYYAAFNDFLPSGDLYVNFTAFNRSEMLQGLPAQQVVINGVGLNEGGIDYSALPADLDGYSPPPTGTPGIFVNYSSPGLLGSSYPYALNIWQMHVDWVNPSNSTLTGPTTISVSPFTDGGYTYVPEPAGNSVDTLGDRLMFRLAYRNFGSHQALVVNQTVTASGTAAPPLGVRWYELDAPSGATSATAWSIKQQATFAPADGTSRWMGSVAMDHAGDMALGYSYSSPNVNPGIAYTGRLAGDTLNKMTQPETILKAGSGYETGSGNRWGDYSSMVLDPSDDCTFWYAQQYYAVTGDYNWSTHIGAFKFAGCTPVALGTVQGTVTDASGNAVAGAYVSTANGFSAITDANGKYSITLAAGTYTETAKAYPYAESSGAQVTVTAGQSTTQDITLQPAPKVTLSGTVTDGGIPQGAAHGWGLYAHVVVMAPMASTAIVASAYTDPVTGKYSVQVPGGFAYAVTATASTDAYNQGYESATKGLIVNQAATQDLVLNITSTCDAPGYGLALGADFNYAPFPPSGWTVTNNVAGSRVVWRSSSYWSDGNYTGGSGLSADANSDRANVGPGSYDTSLVSPPINVADINGKPILHFLVNFQVYTTEALDVDVSVDGGTTWTTALHLTTNQGSNYSTPGVSETVDLSPYIPSGTKQFQVRWHYYNPSSDYDWYAQVDDVTMGTCVAKQGGLVVGQVTDADTGNGLAGVLLTDDLAETAATYLTPQDPNMQDFYALFGTAGTRTLVAATGPSSFVSSTADVKADQAVRDDMALGNADIAVSSLSGSTLAQGETGDVAQVVVTNNGPDTASNVSLKLSLGDHLAYEGASATQGTCTKQGNNSPVCDLGDIASGDSVTVTVSGFGLYVGQGTVSANVSELDNDADSSNNSGSAQVTVNQATSSTGGASQSGGTGGLGWLTLAALLALTLGAGALARAKRVR